MQPPADPNSGDVLTYTWEQLDTEIAVAPPVSTAVGGPAFRSVSPSTSSMRYFPNQNTVNSGALSNTWEVLPSVARTMKFGVNVRDNNVNGGQSSSRETVLTFVASSGPFKVTSQATAVSWNSGETKTITWNVANTNVAPVNCTNVNILLSTDGGFTFPITLKSNVSNNGTASIVVPNVSTTSARIKVESVGNIFYAVNAGTISIQAKEFSMNFTSTNKEVCKPASAIYNFTYNTFLGFNEVTTFSASGNPTGTTVSFNPATATANNTNVEVTVSTSASTLVGNYDISIVGTSGTTSIVKTDTIALAIYDATLTTPVLTTPANNTLAYLKPYSLTWSEDVNATSYEVQIATDASFTSIIEQATANANSFQPQLLAINTLYYWRVKSINSCGESSYSIGSNFTTANEVCATYNATDVPKSIPDNDPIGVNSVISITDSKLVTDINVTVSISHTYDEDLTLALISPNAITILLSVTNGGSGSNYTNTVFDDAASTSIANGTAPFTGTFSPQIPLSYLNAISSLGNWTLKVVDSGDADTGTITSWSLNICGVPTVSNDDDADGVVNAIDQCPNTAFGSTVDELGCFMLPPTNFEIVAVGETCPGKSNGQIIITPHKSYNYTTTINGNTYNFTSATTISNLTAGTYNFCIGVYVADENSTYEQCYTAIVEAGIVISGKASVVSNKALIDIYEGTAPFNVFVNGRSVLQTSLISFSIDVNQGDLIQVKTSVECEGVFEKQIDLTSEIKAYPNPTNGIFEIALPAAQKQVKIELFNMQAQLISSKIYAISNGKVQVSIEDKPTGIYIAKVYLDKPVALKIVKQ